MTERVYSFGSHGGLVGILTEPCGGIARADAPAVLFSNIGLNHRVGPNRLYVELARKLAAAGFRSLRFDLSGFGDSEPRRGGDSHLQRATLDTCEAMDFLEKRGSRRFVLVGLCSGVDSVYRTALQDNRVAGAVFIEGYPYRNRGFWLRFLTLRYLQPARWRRFVRLRMDRLRGTGPVPDLDEVPEVFTRVYPSQNQFTTDLATLVGRGTKLLFIFTVNADGHYNYPDQFHDTFGYRDEVDVEFYTRADHVFSTGTHRQMLLDRLAGWMGERFPQPLQSTRADTSPRDMSMPALYLMGATVGAGRMVRFVTESMLLGA